MAKKKLVIKFVVKYVTFELYFTTMGFHPKIIKEEYITFGLTYTFLEAKQALSAVVVV